MQHQQIIRSLQSIVDKRANTIAELEFFANGYKVLGKKAAVRATKEELKKLREEQAVQKRALGIVLREARWQAWVRDDYYVEPIDSAEVV